uniref:Uncharacterized protein n=1 Tax=Parastrongyloides trichosuri TaxID=131310 RepID=A0A0N4ZPU8_PARTI
MGIFKESNTRREFEKIKKSKSILKKTTSEEDNQKMLQEKFKKKIRDSAEVLREKRNRDKVKTNIKREYRRNSPCKSIVVSENIDSIHYSMDNTISKKTCPCCVEEEVMRTGKIFQRIQIFEKIH